MKTLALLNARRRRKTRRSNPMVKSKRRGAKTTYYYGSKARKKSRPSKASRGSRRSKGFRRSKRHGIKAIRVEHRGDRSAVIRIRANPRRRDGMYRMNPFGGNIMSSVKSVFSKENLTIAAGGVAATVLTQYALNAKGSDGKSLLPMPTTAANQKMVAVGYSVGIPVVGALLTRKLSPAASKGMLIAGLINGIITTWRNYGADSYKKVTGTAEYLTYTPLSDVGGAPGYMATNRFDGTGAALGNSGAFPADAWG